MSRFRPNNIERLLIRSTNWIGDAVMTTPAVRAIRRNFPNSRITMLAKPWVAPVFENSPHVDDIFIYDAKGRHRGVAGIPRLARDLRRQGFDAAILLQNAFEAGLIAFLAGIPVRIGFDTDGRRLLLTHPVRRQPGIKKVHQTLYYLEILRKNGLIIEKPRLELFIGVEDNARAAAILEESGVSAGDFLVGINPGATYGTAKRWFPDRFAELCRRLQKTRNARIAVFGGPGEEDLGERICRAVGGGCVNFSGKTSLREAMALIGRCGLFVTNDSGLMHVAAALDVPLVAVFGSTDFTTTSPAGDLSRIVTVAADCAPCLKTDCPADHRCMREISVDMVYEATAELPKDAEPLR